MRKMNLFVFNSMTLIRVVTIALIASFFSFSPVSNTYACASERLTISGCTDSISRTYAGSEVNLFIPRVAVFGAEVMTVDNAGSSDLMKISLSIVGWVYGINHFNEGVPIEITMPKSLVPNSRLAFSEDDGATWIPIPMVSGPRDITDYVTGTGYKDNGDGTVTIYTYHLSIFGFEVPAAPALAPDPQQQSSITSISPNSAVAGSPTPFVIAGKFVEKISNISINGVPITQASWVQTPTSLSVSMPGKVSGQYLVQVYNGSVPLMSEQAFTFLAPTVIPTIPVVRAKNIYIRCVLDNHLRVAHGISPLCPVGYTRQ